MTEAVRRHGQAVNCKRDQRLMYLLGVQALHPKPKTTIANPEHKVYPYLLRDLRFTIGRTTA